MPKPNAGDLGDYVNFYLGSSYLQTGQTAEAIATLGEFDKTYPDSLLIRDAHVLYANALLAAGRGREAIPVLKKIANRLAQKWNLHWDALMLRQENRRKQQTYCATCTSPCR